MPRTKFGKSTIHRDIILVGGSAGAIHVITEIVRGLPPAFPAVILIAIHTSPSSPGLLPELLDRAGPLPAAMARDGDKLSPGRIYVAPPDFHMIVKANRIRLTRGPKENGFRPAIDPLFRTAAEEFGKRVIGVVLSGGLDDGSEGLLAIKRHGGMCVVQEPAEAVIPSMPANAIRHDHVDQVVPYAEIPAILLQLNGEPIKRQNSVKVKRPQLDVAEEGNYALRDNSYGSAPSSFTCPECGGAIWELRDNGHIHYRCHVGHGYTAEALVAHQDESVEAALWAALRALEEHAALNRQLARNPSNRWPLLHHKYSTKARDAEASARVIRNVLVGKRTVGRRGENHRNVESS